MSSNKASPGSVNRPGAYSASIIQHFPAFCPKHQAVISRGNLYCLWTLSTQSNTDSVFTFRTSPVTESMAYSYSVVSRTKLTS